MRRCAARSERGREALDDIPDASSLIDALQAAYDLLDDVAAELQVLIEEHEESA